MIIISLSSLVSVYLVSSFSLVLTKKRANLIIDSLMDYKNNKGGYPENLNALIPKYISHIPKPSFGYAKNFIYKLEDCEMDSTKGLICNEFQLIYDGELETEAIYISKTKKWKYED